MPWFSCDFSSDTQMVRRDDTYIELLCRLAIRFRCLSNDKIKTSPIRLLREYFPQFRSFTKRMSLLSRCLKAFLALTCLVPRIQMRDYNDTILEIWSQVVSQVENEICLSTTAPTTLEGKYIRDPVNDEEEYIFFEKIKISVCCRIIGNVYHVRWLHYCVMYYYISCIHKTTLWISLHP